MCICQYNRNQQKNVWFIVTFHTNILTLVRVLCDIHSCIKTYIKILYVKDVVFAEKKHKS